MALLEARTNWNIVKDWNTVRRKNKVIVSDTRNSWTGPEFWLLWKISGVTEINVPLIKFKQQKLKIGVHFMQCSYPMIECTLKLCYVYL